MNPDLIYQLSLSSITGIGPVIAKKLCEHFECARDIFSAKYRELESIENIGSSLAASIKSFKDFNKAEKEMRFIERYGIDTLFFTEKKYPYRLKECEDPPTLLFYKGNADLNAAKIISIVGTRRNSDYGRSTVDKIIKELSRHNVIIVSGLAFGIDSIAHRSALQNELQTIGVIAHGLDIIYPPENSGLAREMINCGGLLTEFRSFTKPDKFNFPSRNRIVAGLSDATIVIESDTKGGSMITADLANGYHKEVFAVPGKITDTRSRGCNELIRSSRAAILNNPAKLPEILGWEDVKLPTIRQAMLFPELSEKDQQIVDLLRQKEITALEELHIVSGMSANTLSSSLLSLELKNIVQTLPGKMYKLVN